MSKHRIFIPCALCTRVPATYVARGELLVCRACWQQETFLREEGLCDEN